MSKLNLTLITLFLILSFSYLSFAQESITITTYYPSPYGSYDELATNKLAVDINGVAVASEFVAMQNGDAHIGRSLIIGAGGGSGFAYDEGATTADGTLLVKGNAGIGTTTPGAKLEVYQDASSSWRLGEHPSYVNYSALWNSGRGNGAGSYVLLADNANTFLNAFGAGNLYFREDNNNLMTILNNGDVGIGTASPARKLEVNGAAQSTDFYLSDGVQIQGRSGRNYFRDTENAGDLRVGAAWGMPGIYAQTGACVVGGAGGTSLQNNSLFVTTGGNVGIGTTDPAGYRLRVNGSILTNGVNITNNGDLSMTGNISYGDNTFTIQQQVGGSAAINFYRSGAPNARLYTDTGRWFVAAVGGPGYNSPMPDLAEVFPLINEHDIEAADVMSIDPMGSTAIIKCTKEQDPLLIGVISTEPGMALGVKMPKDDPRTGNALPPEKIKPLALVGRVPCKVSTMNGPIKAGDYLTSSSIPGYAMKATKAGPVLGRALENFDGSKDSKGKILIFCDLGWYYPGDLQKEISDLKKQIEGLIAKK